MMIQCRYHHCCDIDLVFHSPTDLVHSVWFKASIRVCVTVCAPVGVDWCMKSPRYFFGDACCKRCEMKK